MDGFIPGPAIDENMADRPTPYPAIEEQHGGTSNGIERTENRYLTPVTEDEHVYAAADHFQVRNGAQSEQEQEQVSLEQGNGEMAQENGLVMAETTVTGNEDTPGVLSVTEISKLQAMGRVAGELIEKFALTYDRSPRPYARIKASMIREKGAAIAKELDKLGGVEVATEPDADQPLVVQEEAQLTQGLTPIQCETVVALFNIQPSDRAKEPAPEAQDTHLASHLACAAVRLLLADRTEVEGLAQLTVDLCGEAVWQDKLKYYVEPPHPEPEVNVAKGLLQLMVPVVNEFDEVAATSLERITGTIV